MNTRRRKCFRNVCSGAGGGGERWCMLQGRQLNVCPGACEHQSLRELCSYLPDSDREAFSTGHAILHFVILGPLPGQRL